jgi:hypothetical protein
MKIVTELSENVMQRLYHVYVAIFREPEACRYLLMERRDIGEILKYFSSFVRLNPDSAEV